MNIISDFRKDVRHTVSESGGYEWWYFDAVSVSGKYSLVVIYYEGNPFSTRYNGRQLAGDDPKPGEYPAISISVYDKGAPVFYSFTEFKKADCYFDENGPELKMGSNKMTSTQQGKSLVYKLHLDEKLPSGDAINGTIVYDGSPSSQTLFGNTVNENSHTWNLVQPKAHVQADLKISAKNEQPAHIAFEGSGYHDHNIGREPMKDEFDDWYWGRFHFDFGTFVYYVMNKKGKEDHNAWLISSDNTEILEHFDEIDFGDKGLTLFGLKVARKMGFRAGNSEVRLQQSHLLDNGPFYQRYQSDAFIRIPGKGIVESASGITEYIRPDRIYNRLFWPLVDMRIRYKSEKPHWVQKSKMLYRWTW